MEKIKIRKDLSSRIRPNYNLIIKCENEQEQEKVYELLKAGGVICEIST